MSLRQGVRVLFGFAIPRAASLDATWTTVHLARSALSRGHQVRFIEPWDFEVDERGQLCARASAFDAPLDATALVSDLHARSAPRRYLRIDSLDALLLRVAPFDPAVLAFGAMARDRGVTVVNDPDGLLRVTHKGWLATLPDVATPPTLVTASPGTAVLFYEKHRKPVVLKPARGLGGHNVHFVSATDIAGFELAFARIRGRGDHVVVQTYLEEAPQGEKRLVWMDGEVLGGYLRQRAPGELRHNLKQGGTAVPTTVSSAEHAVVARLSPHLLHIGVRLAGIDLIGLHVVEVNALNPGGAYHTDRLHDTDVSGSIIERLERPHTARAPRRTGWEPLAP